MATVGKVSRTWRRYLLPGYLAAKISEKGIIWCLKAGAKLTGIRLGRMTYPVVLAILTTVALLLAVVRIRFLNTGIATRIGSLARHPEMYVKSGLVGWRHHHFGILLAAAESVVNPSLLSYWRRYTTIVSNRMLIALLRPLSRFRRLQYDTSHLSLPNGATPNRLQAIYRVQAEYEARYGDQPILNLSESDCERGWSCLRKLAIPQDAWFVCLHAREGGYLPHLSYHSYRNVDVSTYLPAVEAIVERGGWLIRMGDLTMKPLPQMDHVIDYAHSDVRSDWMDVFCLASCRFCLGNDSGPHVVSQVFGVPTAPANWAPMGHGAYSRRDTWTPKLYRSVKEDRFLTFAEVLLSPLRRLFRTEDFEASRVTVVDNSPEDIRDLAVEMMDRLDGKIRYTAEDERLQKRFKSLLEAEPMYATNARVGRDFLHKYAWLLPEETSEH